MPFPPPTAAPYVSKKCSKQLLELLPYVDFFFSNLEEALSFAEMKGYNVSLMLITKLIRYAWNISI